MDLLFVLLSLIALFGATLYHVTIYDTKKKQNNDTAIRHRNLAVLFGILCLSVLIAYAIHMDKDSLTNSNIVIMKETESSKTAFVSVLDYGPPVHKGLFEITQVC